MTTTAWTVPGYTELQELGKGSQGRVILARRDDDGETVAIKYLEPRLLEDDEEASFFRTEAQTLAELDDPNIARLFSYIESENGAAIIMEPISGVTLRALLENRGDGLSAQAALAILKGSLLGLAAAHTMGVVHRDYKPTNVMVQGDGNSKLIDFGIAVLSGGQGRVGTPAYMAPEQWRGSPASPATDIYAATCVFYECITGHRPYTGDTTQPDTATSLEELHLSGPIPTGDIPRGLRSLVTKGMAKSPRDRPENATDFVAELETAATVAYGPDWERVGRATLNAAALVFLTAVGGHLALTAIQHTAHTGLARVIHSKVTASISGVAVTTAVATYFLYPADAKPPEPPPALTHAQARQVLNQYLTVANQANNQLDSGLLGTVESKPELDMDAAYFAFSRKHHLGSVRPTDIREPQFWIPRIADNRQRWFVVHTGPGSTVAWTWYTNAYLADDPGPRMTRHSANSTLLFTQQSDKTWKLALIVDPPATGTTYPPPALDAQGYAQEVTPNATGYAMTPQEIPATATNTKAAELFATGTCTRAPQTPKKAKAPPPPRDLGWSRRSIASPSAYPVHALKTAGPALVWIATNVTRTLRRTNPRSSWNYGLLYTGAKKSNIIFRKKLTTKHIATTVIINPAKTPGAATNKPSALACGGATVSYTGN